MGGVTESQPINEAVFLLSRLAPGRLDSLRSAHPLIAEELQPGVFAGPSDTLESSVSADHLSAKASVMVAVLDETYHRAEAALAVVSKAIRTARTRRLAGQILVLVGSSSLLGTLALESKTASVIAAVLTLVAALGNLLAEHQEKILNPQMGNVYDAFQHLGEGAYRARALRDQIQLASKYAQAPEELTSLLAQANELCERLNGWFVQLLQHLGAGTTLERG
jgi:hypothetical protein